MRTSPNPLYSKLRSQKKEASLFRSYLRYTHLSFQMMGIIGLGVALGIKLDAYLQCVFPVFMSILAPTSTAYASLIIIKSLIQRPTKKT
ncbi:MAG: AtpZ/AtpI family protein [Bacteroidota bacterium]